MIPTNENHKELYCVVREDGGTTITPTKPSKDAVPDRIRIIAAKGKAITKDGVNLFSCIDVKIEMGVEDAMAPWYEVDAPEEWQRV